MRNTSVLVAAVVFAALAAKTGLSAGVPQSGLPAVALMTFAVLAFSGPGR